MDIAEWWRQRLLDTQAEFEKASEIKGGTVEDKLRNIIQRTDLAHQLAQLERNLAQADLQTLIAQVRNLLAVIHRDGGDYVDEHGLEKSLKDAEEVVCELRRSLDEEQYRAQTQENAKKDSLIEQMEKRAAVQPRVVPLYPRPTRVPRPGLVCDAECDKGFLRASGDVICTICQEPYRRHPYCRGNITTIAGDPQYYIHVSCDGTHLKL